MICKVCGAALAVLFAAWGQAATPLAFEVAFVKPAPPCCAPGQWRENKVDADRIDFPNATLWFCISFAYGVKSYQMSGPGWLRDARYTIVAKGPAGTRRDQLPEMMQSLLAERFKLQLHHETKEASALALVVGRNGPKLHEASAGSSGRAQDDAHFGISMSNEASVAVLRMDVQNAAMSKFANTLTGLLGRPVIDKTGLTASYDFVLEFSRNEAAGPEMTGGYHEPPPLPPAPPNAEPGLSIYSAIQQLGLKLEPLKFPLGVIVIDSAEKIPTEN